MVFPVSILAKQTKPSPPIQGAVPLVCAGIWSKMVKSLLGLCSNGAKISAVLAPSKAQACRHPRPTFGDDVCRFVADCPDRLQPGGSCMVRCQLPYEGEATTAQCPHDNTRPKGAIGDGLVIEIATVTTAVTEKKC